MEELAQDTGREGIQGSLGPAGVGELRKQVGKGSAGGRGDGMAVRTSDASVSSEEAEAHLSPFRVKPESLENLAREALLALR